MEMALGQNLDAVDRVGRGESDQLAAEAPDLASEGRIVALARSEGVAPLLDLIRSRR